MVQCAVVMVVLGHSQLFHVYTYVDVNQGKVLSGAAVASVSGVGLYRIGAVWLVSG